MRQSPTGFRHPWPTDIDGRSKKIRQGVRKEELRKLVKGIMAKTSTAVVERMAASPEICEVLALPNLTR